MSNNFYLGQSPAEFENQTSRYFYGMARTTDGFLKIEKINLDSDVDQVSLQDLTTWSVNSLTETQLQTQLFDQFEEGVDFFEGVDGTTRMPNYKGLAYEQYKWSPDDLYYYIDNNGVLCVRVDNPYVYSFGVITTVLPETLLSNSTAAANAGAHVLAGSYNLGTIINTGNPLENITSTNLSFVSDTEGTVYSISMGTITGS
jgi:hypothetical protein